jgi:hypothetical protein
MGWLQDIAGSYYNGFACDADDAGMYCYKFDCGSAFERSIGPSTELANNEIHTRNNIRSSEPAFYMGKVYDIYVEASSVSASWARFCCGSNCYDIRSGQRP